MSKQSVETLLDLVEIKISYMDVLDRDDAKELRVLERCRDELKMLTGSATADVVPFVRAQRRAGMREPALAAV